VTAAVPTYFGIVGVVPPALVHVTGRPAVAGPTGRHQPDKKPLFNEIAFACMAALGRPCRRTSRALVRQHQPKPARNTTKPKTLPRCHLAAVPEWRQHLGAMNSLQASNDALGWEFTTRALEAIRDSEDLREGIRAFFDKRAPVWTGR
jgi:hypothetical protein